jgi:glycosyltransferase involved in cell wall biosynthesis
MSRISVLQIVPSLAVGGAERMAAQLMHALDPSRIEVAALSLYAPEGTQLEQFLAAADLPVQYLQKRSGFDPRMFGQISRAISTFRPDIVHTHLHALNYTMPILLRSSKPRVVHTVHSIAEREQQRIGKWVPKILFSKRVTPVAIASEVQKSIRRVYGVNSVLIPNGIPVTAYRQEPLSLAQWRQQQGFAPDHVLFTCVGRLERVKNHRCLIEAFALACGKAESAHLVLAGDGSERGPLTEQLHSLGLQQRVHLLGVRSDIPALLGASDVFVFASDYEGCPLSVMEAAAAGLPIIGTAVGGIPEMVPSEVGILVAPGDSTSLARAMASLCTDTQRRAAMAHAALKHAATFDIAKMAAGYEELYAELLQQEFLPKSGHRSLAAARECGG